MVAGVNWVTLCHECRRELFVANYVSFVHFEVFFILDNKLIGYADDSTLIADVSSSSVRVTVAESLIRDIDNVNVW